MNNNNNEIEFHVSTIDYTWSSLTLLLVTVIRMW